MSTTGMALNLADGDWTRLRQILQQLGSSLRLGPNSTPTVASITTSGTGRFDGGVGVGVAPNINDLLNLYRSSANYCGIKLNNAGAGDVVTRFLLGGNLKWIVGVDNSDDDKFKIGRSGAVAGFGATYDFAIDSSGNFDFQSGNFSNVGTIGCGAITGGTYNALTLAAAVDGFTVAGGSTNSRTLTVTGGDRTLDQDVSDGADPSLLVRPGATYVIAASDSPAHIIAQADYACDGTADDVQIQAAIDACPASGGLIILSQGNYDITAKITLKPGIHLEGVSWETKLNLANDVNDDVLYFDADAANEGDIRLANFRIAGNSSNQTSGHGIHFKGSGGNEPMDCHFDRVLVMYAKQDGMHIVGDGTTKAWGMQFRNCLTEYCSDVGLYLECNQAYVFGHFSAYNEGEDVHLKDCLFINIVGLTVFSTTAITAGSHAIHLEGTDYSTLSGCSIYRSSNKNVTAYGIYLNTATYTTISGCSIYESSATYKFNSGIYAYYATNCTISDNSIIGCYIGIRLNPSPNMNIVVGNGVSGNTIPISGYGTYVADNGLAVASGPIAKTGDYTVPTGFNRAGFSNSGASGTITLTLPAATVGLEFAFVVVAAQQLRIDPDGTETLAKADGGAQLAAGEYIYNATAGGVIHLKCFTAGQWEAFDVVGTWLEQTP